MSGVRPIEMIVQSVLSLRAVTYTLHNHFCPTELLHILCMPLLMLISKPTDYILSYITRLRLFPLHPTSHIFFSSWCKKSISLSQIKLSRNSFTSKSVTVLLFLTSISITLLPIDCQQTLVSFFSWLEIFLLIISSFWYIL